MRQTAPTNGGLWLPKRGESSSDERFIRNGGYDTYMATLWEMTVFSSSSNS